MAPLLDEAPCTEGAYDAVAQVEEPAGTLKQLPGRGVLGKVALASVALAAVSVAAALTTLALRGDGPVEQLPANPRQLAWMCNTLQPAPQLVSQVFSMPYPWDYGCKGQGGQAVPNPPSETAQWPGQQNWCWNWIKHKGCKDMMGKMNWKDAQDRAAAMGLAPPAAVVRIQPVLNPAVCESYDLGATVAADAAETAAAQAWLQQNVRIYVLNLERDAERKAFVSNRMAQLGLQFQFIPGVDLRVPGSYAQAKMQGIIPMNFNFQLANQNGGGVAGMVGTAAAHLRAMASIAGSGAQQQLALLLEDDVSLEGDFAVKLMRLINNEAPCDWAVISLKSACPYGICVTPHLTRVLPDLNEPADRCRHGVNYGFFGMLYKLDKLNDLRARLSQRVWNERTPHCLDVDVALASISDQVSYYAVPYWQTPGFLQMGGHGSTRTQNNAAPVDTTEPGGARA